MVASQVVAFSCVDAAVVVHFTVQNVRHHTTLWRNGCSVVTLMKTVALYSNWFTENILNHQNHVNS